MPKPASRNLVRTEDRSALSRRAVLAGMPLLLAGCAGGGFFSGGYGSTRDGGFFVPAVDITTIDPGLMRTEVVWHGKEKPGSIVVNVPQRRLYLVEKGGRALRYGIGVGRSEGANFRGQAVIGRKEKWPHWTPTANMMAAIPLYRNYAGGMDGGPDNPLGAARALSLPQRPRHVFPPARHHRAGDHRPRRLLRLHPPVQSGHHRPLRPRTGRHPCDGGAGVTR